MSLAYSLKDIHFEYRLDRQTVMALKGVSLELTEGDFVCLNGPSGSGKSTLLNLLGLIEPLQNGTVAMHGRDLKALGEDEKNTIRKTELGFIFQSFHLFPVLTAEENVVYFLARQGLGVKERNQRAQEALKAVGLWEHRKKKPLEMSGGQRQRVAIARAIAKRPRVIIADEPTASLDQATGKEIMDLFAHANRETGATIIVSSHDPMVQAFCRSKVSLLDGLVSARSVA